MTGLGSGLALGAVLPAVAYGPIDDSWVRAYAAAALDPNPLHRDLAVARAAGFGGLVVPGMLLLGLCGRAVAGWMAAEGGGRRLLHLSGRFLAPLAAPVSVEVSGRVVAVAAARTVLRLTVKAASASGPLACVGEAWLSPPPGG